MMFSELDKLKAMAVVHIFETSQPFGDYAAYAVLNDGAGISYGINQFTHRSGSLADVIEEYLRSGGKTGKDVFAKCLPLLRSASRLAIKRAASNTRLENALRSAAKTPEMNAAQRVVAFERYLRPAIEACAGSGFTAPLTLAVIYDSINHGSWAMIRDRVPANSLSETDWITRYVRTRHAWLLSIPRLRATAYRTAFFLGQIARNNWRLDLPLLVHGVALRSEHLRIDNGRYAQGQPSSTVPPQNSPGPATDDRPQVRAIPANATADGLDKVQEKVDEAAAVYDQVEAIVRTVSVRTDAAKSLWATIIGTIWQSVWAIVSFLIGLPKEVWLAVAIIVAVILIFYLYRQLSLGRIREISKNL